MKKFFNTAGPVTRPSHYKIDPLHRWDLEEMLTLIEQEKYFMLHAPRQTGKTSSLLALEEYLNTEGRYTAVYTNVENAQAARNDIAEGMGTIVSSLARRLKQEDLSQELMQLLTSIPPTDLLSEALSRISGRFENPFVLFIDEIDALVGDTLVSVLRQLRSGYDRRPGAFPSTVILCGVRDIRDYRIHRSNEDIITGGSAFNIKAESLRLGNFSRQDIRELYLQHTDVTGQVFNEECFDLVWDYTRGQPWLVNALAHEVTWKMKENRDPKVVITAEKLQEAKERLVVSRQTHLDQLADKLREERVRRVILPMILGETRKVEEDDKEYCVDLGLVERTEVGLQISNAIYKEIIPRELSREQQENMLSNFSPRWLKSLMLQWRYTTGGEVRYQKVVLELKVLKKKESLEKVKALALEQTAEYAISCSTPMPISLSLTGRAARAGKKSP